MERWRRWPFNLAAAASLLLAIAVVPLWITSEWRQYTFDIQFPGRPDANPYRLDLLALTSAEGGIRIHHQKITVTDPQQIAEYARVSGTAPRLYFGTVGNPPIYTGLSQLKFGHIPRFVNASDPGSTQTKEELRVPDWFFLLLAAILPGLWLFRHRRFARQRRRIAMQQCVRCGYDLRATPDRCPECGSVPEAARVKGTTESD